ncbi:MAG TPA: T9SS type A sorting domain-containing protein [Flavobacteriales bacterium]|nr:T9SS type A sorting domain-containing protein [Flavobacteriales bacterium]
MKSTIKTYFNYIILAVVYVGSTRISCAQNWTGNVNADWNNSANWSSWPLGGQDILIDPANYTGAASSPVININSVFTPAGVLVQNGAQLTVNANLTASARVEILGAGTLVTINAGTFHANGGGSDGRFIAGDAANVVVNGGTIKANQRIIVELGAHLNQYGGTVNPIDELAIGDGDINGGSLYNLNNGALITAGIGFENEAGLFYPALHMLNGTLNVSGDISWLGEAPGAGGAKLILEGGNATIGGNLINDAASTIDMYMKLAGNAVVNFNGTLIDMVRSTDSVLQQDASVLTVNSAATWNNTGVVTCISGALVVNGNTTLQGSGSYALYNVTINSGKTLSQVASTMQVNGDFTNNGVFNANTHAIEIAGNIAQTIGGSSVTSFYDLMINNTSATGVVLGNAASVSGYMGLINGKFTTSSSAILTLMDNATSNSGWAGSFVNGPLKKLGNDAYIFPIGKNNRWRRLEISAPAAITSEFTAEYTDTSYVSILPVSSPLTAVSNLEYWQLSKLDPADDVQVSLYWEDATSSGITDCANISMAHWNGSAWNNLLSNATGVCSGTGNGYVSTTTPVSNAGIFTFGFYDGVTVQNINLCSGESIQVGSSTYAASGTYMDVLTAADLSDSIVITQLTVTPLPVVTQAGITLTANTTGSETYQWVDCTNGYAVLAGETLNEFTDNVNGTYAVVVTNNGCVDTSACFAITTVNVAEENTNKNDFILFPNPASSTVTIQANLTGNGIVKIDVVDVSGKVIRSFTDQMAAGPYTRQLDLNGIASGIYYINMQQAGVSGVRKLVVEK